MSDAVLAGLSVLVAEDDYYLADDVRMALEAAGAAVRGPRPDVDAVLELARDSRLDCAVLDVNLGDGPSFVPARALKALGVPFVFVTGYNRDVVPSDLADARQLQKPVLPHELVRAV